jgi:hypothetical protein
MHKSWCLARAGAKRFGGTACAYLAAALRSVWSEEKAARAAIEAMKARVRHSIATLAADHAACAEFMVAWYAAEESRRIPATVLPFPPRRPVAPSAPARRAVPRAA